MLSYAVTSCATNCKSKENRSTFKVLVDGKFRQQWVNALHGVPLEHVHFQKDAIPTVFDSTAKRKRLASPFKCKKILLITKSNKNTSYYVNKPNESSTVFQNKISNDISLNKSSSITNDCREDCNTNFIKEEIVKDKESVSSLFANPDLIAVEHQYCMLRPVNSDTTLEDIYDPKSSLSSNGECKITKIDIDGTPTVFNVNNFKFSMLNKCKQEEKSHDFTTTHYKKLGSSGVNDLAHDEIEEFEPLNVYTGNETFEKKLISTSVTFDNVVFKFDEICENDIGGDYNLSLPKPWNVCTSKAKEGKVLLFTYAMPVLHDKVEKFIFEKTVIVTACRKVQYEVHSTPTNVPETTLPLYLDNITDLPNILKKFKDMRICKGVQTENIKKFVEPSVLSHWVSDIFRHKNCFLLSFNAGRCSNCKKLNKNLARTVITLKKSQKYRASRVSKFLDQVKFKAM